MKKNIKNYLIMLICAVSLTGCSDNWSGADLKTGGSRYGLKYGQEYEVVREVYVSCGKDYIVNYNSDYGEGVTETKHSEGKYITLTPGTRFKATRVTKNGSYNNGYFYTPFGKLLSPSPYAGLEFSFDRLISDNSGRPYPYTYIRKVEK